MRWTRASTSGRERADGGRRRGREARGGRLEKGWGGRRAGGEGPAGGTITPLVLKVTAVLQNPEISSSRAFWHSHKLPHIWEYIWSRTWVFATRYAGLYNSEERIVVCTARALALFLGAQRDPAKCG